MTLGPITIGAPEGALVQRGTGGATWQRCIGMGLRWRLVSTNGPMLFQTGQYQPTEDRELQQAWVCVASDDPAVSVGTVEWRDVPTVPRGK